MDLSSKMDIPKNALAKNSYAELREKVHTYWEAGRKIDAHIRAENHGTERAGFSLRREN